MDVNEKLEKAEKKLQTYLEQRSGIDEKIKKAEKEVENYKQLLNQKKFDEANDVLHSKGLSLDEIIKAVQAGDVLSLQEKLEQG